MVVRAQTRRPVVFTTRLQGRTIEGIDLLSILGSECQMKMRRPLCRFVQANGSVTLWAAQFDAVRWQPFRDNSNAERSEPRRKNDLLAA